MLLPSLLVPRRFLRYSLPVMLSRYGFFLLTLLNAAGLSAVSLYDLVSSPDVLLNEGELLQFHPGGVTPLLLPNIDLSGDIAEKMQSAELNIGIEGLFFTPSDQLPPGYRNTPVPERNLILYNIFRSVSKLEGLEYFSVSRQEMRLLFEESWFIVNPDKPHQAFADPLVQNIPVQETIFVHQKDKSFGNNELEMTFTTSGDATAVRLVNLTPMRYKGIFRIVNPGNMQIHLIAVPVDEGLLMYGTMSAQTLDIKAFESRARNSFTNRVIALTGWYRDQLFQNF